MDNQLTFVRDISWQEVLNDWRERERDYWGWEEHIKERGFKDWDEFRARIHSKFCNPAKREWKLYRIEDPYEFVPRMFCGAFPGWKKYYPVNTKQIRFVDLVKNNKVTQNPKVASIIKSFPSSTIMIGICYKNDFVIFEGTHRASAISILAAQNNRSKFDLQLVLTNLEDDEQRYFEQFISQK
ncbi:MAG: hypothetical protein ABH826_04210 [Patescibacteria group bacterium]|nr:hypothetical protein [Patescibacteria group bacterium]